MKINNVMILSCLAILLLFPNSASADCVDFSSFTSFYLPGGNAVVLYAGSIPLAQFDVPDCLVLPSSQIQLLKSYMCDGDELLIDNQKCIVIAVRSLY